MRTVGVEMADPDMTHPIQGTKAFFKDWVLHTNISRLSCFPDILLESSVEMDQGANATSAAKFSVSCHVCSCSPHETV